MKIRIIKIFIKNTQEVKIIKPMEKIIDLKDLESFRQSFVEAGSSVLFTYEELG
ncbi:MAG: hypothetical protein LBN27_01990 [Prevotellaceae bacterium]|jgi:hypothetical protein|nr:hypothetical protein [Prevotellaceae bacterium]